MGKTWLVEGFCPVDHYHCLMPVEYEAVEENGVVQEYQKSKMVCRHSLSGQCEQKEDHESSFSCIECKIYSFQFRSVLSVCI